MGRAVFDSFRNQDFNKFFKHSVFALNEPEFKDFLFNVRNQDIRNHLTELHALPIPDDANTSRKMGNCVCT